MSFPPDLPEFSRDPHPLAALQRELTFLPDCRERSLPMIVKVDSSKSVTLWACVMLAVAAFICMDFVLS